MRSKQIEDLTAALKGSDQSKSKLKKTLEEKDEKLKLLQTSITQTENLEKELEESRQKNNEIEQENIALQQQIEEMQAEHEEESSENKTIINQKQGEINALTKHNDELLSQYEAMQKEISAMQEKAPVKKEIKTEPGETGGKFDLLTKFIEAKNNAKVWQEKCEEKAVLLAIRDKELKILKKREASRDKKKRIMLLSTSSVKNPICVDD